MGVDLIFLSRNTYIDVDKKTKARLSSSSRVSATFQKYAYSSNYNDNIISLLNAQKN